MKYISTYCRISPKQIQLNGTLLFANDFPQIDDFLKHVYVSFNIQYPKFYKMDRLSKLAFVATEAMKSVQPNIGNYGEDEIALIFANRQASAETDLKYQQTYENEGSPSPALFVYTLPNILIGELAIRNKWYGENLFVVTPNFDPQFFDNYIQILFQKGANACLCGWVNSLDETEVFLFFVEQSDSLSLGLPLTLDTLTTLYKTQ